MKKLLSVLMVVGLSLSLTGCPKKAAEPEGEGEFVEGASTGATEKGSEAAADEMQEDKKKEEAPAEAPPADAPPAE